MITADNLTSVLNQLTSEEITRAMESKGDNIALYANGYGYVYFESFEYSEENEEEILSTGGLICDKDTFLTLVSESETTNKSLLELI